MLDKIKEFLAKGGELIYDDYDEPIARIKGRDYLIQPTCRDVLTNVVQAIDDLASNRSLYNDERFCQTCKIETKHEIYSDGHERDSFGDYVECTKCRIRR